MSQQLRMTRFATLVIAFAAVVSFSHPASAALYNGAGPGTSTINSGGGGDYVSLAAAVTAINATPLTGGDWTFLIASDTTETVKVVLGQNTNGRKLIFKPAPATNPTINFDSSEATGSGWGGNWVIGTATKNSSTAPVKTDNVVIDGSNNGTTSRNLTIRNSGNANSSNLITIAGDCDNFVIKNTKLLSVGASPLRAVRIAATNNPPPNQTPDNALVDNNEITATGSSSMGGVMVTRNGGSTPTLGGNNTIIRNNTIIAPLGITANEYRNLTITKNIIDAYDVSGGGTGVGIQLFEGSTTTSAPAIQVDVTQNEILQVQRGATSAGSAIGLQVSGVAASGAVSPIVNITNNAVGKTGLIGSGTGNNSRGIYVDYPGANVTVAYNSVNVSVPSGYTLTSPSVGIGIDNTVSTSTATVRNNIVRVDSPSGRGLSRSSTLGTWSSEGNDVFLAGGAVFGNDGGVVKNTLADWRASTGFDAFTTEADPTATVPAGPGRWTSANNLRFTSPAVSQFATTPFGGITSDLSGTTRSVTQPYKGAFEGNGYYTSAAQSWERFE